MTTLRELCRVLATAVHVPGVDRWAEQLGRRELLPGLDHEINALDAALLLAAVVAAPRPADAPRVVAALAEAATEGGTVNPLCTWCGTAYEPRSNGGSVQRFCSAPCRRAFDSACRIWAAAEYEAERVSIFALRTAFYERARCVESNPSSERSKAPETGTCTDGPLRGAAPMADVR